MLQSTYVKYFISFVATLAVFQQCNGACYFSTELQGEFVMQTVMNGPTRAGLQRGFSDQGINSNSGDTPQVQYSVVNITDDAIPVWGQCYKRIGKSVILMSNSGGTNCFRCFHLKLRSHNVLQVHTAGLDYIYKCHTTEEGAVATCPSEEAVQKNNGNAAEIILYKTKQAGGGEIIKEYCPINGRFMFTYDLNDGSENKTECALANSSLGSCPYGWAINLQFRDCSFENHEITFECLGHWEGKDNQHYLALYDTRPADNKRPSYRCALYRERNDGSIDLALSSDSTCSTDLHHASRGYEALQLKPVPQTNWPREVTRSDCRFPDWLIGNWQHLIVNDNTMLYKDHSTFKTYTIKCTTNVRNDELDKKILVFTRTQCGDEEYKCLWIKKRSPNVLEFQMSLSTSKNSNTELCSASNFRNDTWITQARLMKAQQSPCPVAGEYTGHIPDDNGLCAKLSSDCHSMEIMYFIVSDCLHKEVYEERQYKCLGQWEEDGLLYTYTQRNDLAASTYECFVGSIVSNSQIHIMEAGDHCTRHVNLLQNGMKLYKQASCYGTNASPRPVLSTTRVKESSSTSQSTEPWTPGVVTPSPDASNNISNATSYISSIVLVILTIFLTCSLR